MGRQLRADGLRRGRGDGACRRTTSAISQFAKKYGLPIKQVIASPAEDLSRSDAWQELVRRQGHGVCVNSGKYDGLDYQAGGRRHRRRPARPKAWATSRCSGACATGASRASATGAARSRSSTATACGDVPVPDEQLPVVLPEDCVPDGTGNPLQQARRFRRTAPARKCGKPAQRETDTMDTFVDSSWYFSRYACADNGNAMVDERVNYWLPVDQYIGGIEHAILHLLYSRFWTKVMRDLGLVKLDEPFTQPAHPGHGAERDLLPQDRHRAHHLLQPGRCRGRPSTTRAAAPAPRCAPTASRWSPAASAPCRSRRTTASIRRR